MNKNLAFDEEIEPINEIDSDRLGHVLVDIIQEEIVFLYDTRSNNNVSSQANYSLKTIAHSIKKSLIKMFPKFQADISNIITCRDARLFSYISKRYYPLEEGIQALINVYSMLETYGIDNRPREKSYILTKLKEMTSSIEHFKMIVLDMERQREHQKKVDDGERGGKEKLAIGIVQAIIDHSLSHRRHLCEACKNHPVAFELKVDSIWNRFKNIHPCSININLPEDFDAEADLINAYKAQTNDKEFYVFYNKYTNLLTEYCPEDDVGKYKTWSKGTLKNNISELRKFIQKHSR